MLLLTSGYEYPFFTSAEIAEEERQDAVGLLDIRGDRVPLNIPSQLVVAH
jgi:hypothetical protein